jgi:GntR family transcriptional repressor for pyruvate dehydrogenase complex
VVLDLIKVKLASAPRSEELMRQSLGHHTQVFDAISRGEPEAAEAIARANLRDYYAEYLSAEDGAVLNLLATVRSTGLTSRPS